MVAADASGDPAAKTPRRSIRPEQLVVAALGLGSGTALFVYLLAGISIVASLMATVTIVVSASVVLLRRVSDGRRTAVLRAARLGVVTGAAGTVAYDLTRVAVVELFELPIRPFEAVPLFGQLLLGSSTATAVTDAVGVAYHVANGVGFGVAYTVLFGRHGPGTGMAFGVALEAAMLTVYPGWLDIRALNEFFSVSIAGHIAYGLALGYGARRLLGPAS